MSSVRFIRSTFPLVWGRQGRVRWIAWIRRIPARLLLLWGSAILHASTEPLWQPCIIRRPTVNALPRLLIGRPLLWKASAHWHTTWLGQRCAARRTDGGSLAVILPTTRTRYHGRTPFRTNGPTVCSALYITAARSHAPGKALRIPTHAAGVVGQCTIRHYAAQMDYYFCGVFVGCVTPLYESPANTVQLPIYLPVPCWYADTSK